jgi:hypothetical protein
VKCQHKNMQHVLDSTYAIFLDSNQSEERID